MKYVSIIAILMSSLSFSQSREEIRTYLEQNLKELTYFKTEYETKVQKVETEYYVELKNESFIFTTHKKSTGKITVREVSSFTQIVIYVEALKWQDMATLEVKSELEWFRNMPFNYVDLQLKPFTLGTYRNKIIDARYGILQENELIFDAGEEFMVEYILRGESEVREAPIKIDKVQFNFLTQNESEQANTNSSNAIFYMFELSKLSGGEEYKP